MQHFAIALVCCMASGSKQYGLEPTDTLEQRAFLKSLGNECGLHAKARPKPCIRNSFSTVEALTTLLLHSGKAARNLVKPRRQAILGSQVDILQRGAQTRMAAKHTVRKSDSKTPLVPLVLGPPAHLTGLDVGNQYLNVERSCSLSGDQVDMKVFRLAQQPALFHIQGLLSKGECDHLLAIGRAIGLQEARTDTAAGSSARTRCSVAYFDRTAASDTTVQDIVGALENIFLQTEVVEASSWSKGARCAEMHILKYSEGGEFKLHYDASSMEITPDGRFKNPAPSYGTRLLTVLLYLDDVGETWFPLAVNHSKNIYVPTQLDALNMASTLRPGSNGVMAQPKKGDAVVFYNFLNDGTGKLDLLSLHAGLPAASEKSVATFFFHTFVKTLEEKSGKKGRSKHAAKKGFR